MGASFLKDVQNSMYKLCTVFNLTVFFLVGVSGVRNLFCFPIPEFPSRNISLITKTEYKEILPVKGVLCGASLWCT